MWSRVRCCIECQASFREWEQNGSPLLEQARGQTYALELQLLTASVCLIETRGLKPPINLTVHSWPLHEASTGTG